MRFKRMLAAVLCVTAAVFCVAAAGCNARRSKYGSAFRLPLAAEPAQLDPQVAADAASKEVLCAIMEGLTRLAEDKTLLPGIAKEWSVSADRKTVVFTLREAVWSDGTALTADDFAFAFARAVDPATRSPLKNEFRNVKTAEATDAHTFTVTLRSPDGSFPYKMAGTAFYPCNRAFFQKTGGRYGMEAEQVLCNGAFLLSSWSHGEYLILRKNQKYYASEEILPDAVRYVMGTSEQDAASLLSSEALSACAVPADQLGAVSRAKLATATVNDGLYALWFNTKNEALKQPSVRLGLCGAMDRGKLATAIEAAGEREAVGFVPPDATCGGRPYVSESDTLGAFAKGGRVGDLPQLTLLCGEDELSVSVATEILQGWQKRLSLYFKLEKVSAATLDARLQSGEFDLALGTVVGAGATAAQALSAFASDSDRNVSGLADQTLDRLLSDARASETKEAARAAEARLYALCPCVPLAYPARVFAFGKGVQGVKVRAFDGGEFGAVFEFRAATRQA